MESFVYLVTNKFILLAFDGNIEVDTGDFKMIGNNIKKAYKTGATTLVSIIGHPQKMTNLYKYVLELSKLDRDITPQQIILDIKDLLPKGIDDLQVLMQSVTDILEEMKSGDSSKIDQAILLDKLQNAKGIKELIENKQDINPNYLAIFNYNDAEGYNFYGANIVGNFVIDYIPMNKFNLVTNSYIMGIFSPRKIATEMKLIQEKYNKLISNILTTSDWENLPFSNSMISECKECMKAAIEEITPFTNKPEVYFWEIGTHTNNEWIEPMPINDTFSEITIENKMTLKVPGKGKSFRDMNFGD